MGECNWMVVVETGGWWLLLDGDDGGGFEACGDNSFAQRDVKDVYEDVCTFSRTVPQHAARCVVWTWTFVSIEPAECSFHTVRIIRRRWSLLCRHVVVCLKASKEMIQLIGQQGGTVADLWSNSLHRLLVSLLLLKRWDLLLQCCCLASLMPRDRLALAVLRPISSAALKAAFQVFRSWWTSPVSHGFWLAQTVKILYIIKRLGDVSDGCFHVLLCCYCRWQYSNIGLAIQI